MTSRMTKALREASALLRAPQRFVPLVSKVAIDRWRTTFTPRHLYSYASTKVPSPDALRSLINWILNAQRSDGGIAAYYSLLTGYSASYPEVTGYLVPTLYDFVGLIAANEDDAAVRHAAYRATDWLLSLQMPSGAFPSGLKLRGVAASPSIFNTGQILQGLVRAYTESRKPEILKSAIAAGDWLAEIQQPDGCWSGLGVYQDSAHTYYSMVSWSLAQLAAVSNEPRHSRATHKNIDWVLSQMQPSGWIDGINLQGFPIYLHFIAYVIQGLLEAGILLRRDDAIAAAAKSAWVLLRKFETHKRLRGTYESDFSRGQKFSCLTGNAQMSCVWLRLFEVTGDLRYLNAALKINEMLKQSLPATGGRGIVGGVAGSLPIWGPYQPLRFISWGAKFSADALMLERRLIAQAGMKVGAVREASECA